MSRRRGGYCYLRSCYVPPTSEQVDSDRDNVVKSINFEMQENHLCRLSRNISCRYLEMHLTLNVSIARHDIPTHLCIMKHIRISCLEDKQAADLIRVSH